MHCSAVEESTQVSTKPSSRCSRMVGYCAPRLWHVAFVISFGCGYRVEAGILPTILVEKGCIGDADLRK